MIDKIKSIIRNSIDIKEIIYLDNKIIKTIEKVSNVIIDSFTNEGKVLFCGNGGSAADAQHLAAEFSDRFYFDRPPLFSEALHVNSSYVTAVANDYSYDEIYARLVQAMGKKGDVLVGLSTSGNSSNIVKAFIKAKEIGIKTIALTGSKSSKLSEISDYLINVPSNITPRIQESHIMIGHIICELVEENIFRSYKK